MTEARYRRALRARVRSFWAGYSDYPEFLDGFTQDIRRGIIWAWEQGSKECGVLPSEWGLEEINALQAFVTGQVMQVGIFAAAIEGKTKALGGLLGPLLSRTEMWVNRYPEAKTIAAAMACGDKKKIWVLGPTEEHCKSCKGFERRVYRYSVWLKNGAIPGGWKLTCTGLR